MRRRRVTLSGAPPIVDTIGGMEQDAATRRAWRDGLGVSLATSAYGVSFGALGVAAGLDIWQTCVLSLLMFTGGSQFAFVGVVASGGIGALPAAIASAVLLGVRNVAYGLRMAPIVGEGIARRLAATPFTIDESAAVALAQTSTRARRVGFWVTGVAIYLGWNLSTLLGALLGDVLGDPRAYGLDAAAAAAFLALLWPRLRRGEAVVVGGAAGVVAAVVTPVTVPGVPVLIAGVVAVVLALLWPGGSDRASADGRSASDGHDGEAPDVPERRGLP